MAWAVQKYSNPLFLEQVLAAKSVPRPQSEQETACDAAATSASTSSKTKFNVPRARNFTLCTQIPVYTE